MSFCSYEEAWGSPYEIETEQKNDHVKKQLEDPNDYEEFTGGMVETAPLKGSLLGGVIPEEQWKTNTPQLCEKDDISSFEAKFDQKIDKLVSTLENYANGIKKNMGIDIPTTSWTDLLLFIALGILAIVILDLFFKFGKMIVTTKLEAKYSQSQSFDTGSTGGDYFSRAPQQFNRYGGYRMQGPEYGGFRRH